MATPIPNKVSAAIKNLEAANEILYTTTIDGKYHTSKVGSSHPYWIIDREITALKEFAKTLPNPTEDTPMATSKQAEADKIYNAIIANYTATSGTPCESGKVAARKAVDAAFGIVGSKIYKVYIPSITVVLEDNSKLSIPLDYYVEKDNMSRAKTIEELEQGIAGTWKRFISDKIVSALRGKADLS